MTPAEFVRVWAAWDERPRSEKEAHAMETASAAIAGGLGIPTLKFRDLLSTCHRFGLEREACLSVVRFAASQLKGTDHESH